LCLVDYRSIDYSINHFILQQIIYMDLTEYMVFLPLLIYGIALADLFSQWKRFFDIKEIMFHMH